MRDFIKALTGGRVEEVKRLVNNAVVDVNDAIDEYGTTALIYAVKNRFYEMTAVLVEDLKADTRVRDASGKTAYGYVADDDTFVGINIRLFLSSTGGLVEPEEPDGALTGYSLGPS